MLLTLREAIRIGFRDVRLCRESRVVGTSVSPTGWAHVCSELRGWRAQQTARGLKEDTIAPRERLVRRFLEFANEYP